MLLCVKQILDEIHTLLASISHLSLSIPGDVSKLELFIQAVDPLTFSTLIRISLAQVSTPAIPPQVRSYLSSCKIDLV